MEAIVEKLVSYCITNGYVDSNNEDWLRYGIEVRLATLYVLIPLFVLACFLSGLQCAIPFFASFFFLKRFTGGYHAKTPHGCLLVSLLLEVFFLTVIHPRLNSVGILLIDLFCFISIFLLAPYNHPGLHLTTEERNALVRASRRTVIILILGNILCMYGELTSIAKKMIALVLVLASITAMLAIPASAAALGEEDIARVPVFRCTNCGIGAMRLIYHHEATDDDLETYDLYQCDYCGTTLKNVTSCG